MEIENKDDTLYFNLENSLLNTAMLEIESTEDGKIDIGGKLYTKVSKRLQILRQRLGFNIRIDTSLLHLDTSNVVARAEISVFKNNQWFPVSTGHAEEIRGDSEINRFSAVENAETSAIGRALAGMGLSGDEYASLEEIVIAKNKKTREEGKQSPGAGSTENLPLVEKDNEKVSESMMSYLRKLLTETETDLEGFVKYYNVKNITEMSYKKVKEALELLKKKGKKVKARKEVERDEQFKKQQQREALEVLTENNKPKTFVSYDLDESNEPKEAQRNPVVVNDDDIMIDDDITIEEDSEKLESKEGESKEDPVVDEKTDSKDVVDEKTDSKDVEVETKDAPKKSNKKADKKESTKAKAKAKASSKTKAANKSKSPKKSGTKKVVEKDISNPNKNAGKDDLTDDDDITL